jgi:hypothetical protein
MKKTVISLIAIGYTILSFAQPWTVTPTDYEFSMNVIGKVLIDSETINQQDSYIGAFVDDVCVGVCSPVNDDGAYNLFYLAIYSNTSSGETVEFKFMDNLDVEYTIANSIEFGSDLIIGNYENPFLWMDVEAYASTDFLSFSFEEEFTPALINSVEKTIDIVVAHDANIAWLTPAFEIAPGAKAYLNGIEQVSEVTTNDYSSAVVYTVAGVDASSSNWTVNVSLDYTDVADDVYWGINVFPNPAKDYTCIDAGNLNASNITIVDIYGKVLVEFVPTQNIGNQYTVSIENLKPGLYFIQLQFEKSKYVRSLIKM